MKSMHSDAALFDATEPLFDALEPRQMLFAGPMLTALPTTGMMENANNTVVRMLTNYGAVDIELYDTTNPITVANFLSYIKSGDWEETFFHRLTKVATSGIGVLQGGGFRFQDGVGKTNVTQKSAIVNEFVRSNTERTISMAKLGGNPNSATSQWFINTTNNLNLDPPNNGGFTVFGKIIQGWNVIQTIAALTPTNINAALGENPIFGAFNETPVAANYNPTTGPTESTLVYLNDIEIIKAFGPTQFFSQAAYYPEGFRSNFSTAQVHLINNSVTGTNSYQIIARYASGLRDQVIWSGQIEANRRVTVPIYDVAVPTLDLVRKATAFSIEVRASRAISAQFNHAENGAAINESFMSTNNVPNGWLTTWGFATGKQADDIQNFVLYYNPNATPIQINVEIIGENGINHGVNTKTIEPFRRGGVAIHNISTVPDGDLSYRVTSVSPFIASLSAYKINGNTRDGSTFAGNLINGSPEGIIAGVRIPTVGDAEIDVVYTPGPGIAFVTLDFINNAGTVFNSVTEQLFPTGRRTSFNLANISALPKNQFFSVRYRSLDLSLPMAVSYRTEFAGDDLVTAASTISSKNLYFANAFNDPAVPGSSNEFYSVMNPYEGANMSVSFVALAHFSDGTIIPVGYATNMAARANVHFAPQNNPNVQAKINSSAGFKNYSISIQATIKRNGTAVDGAIVAQQTRFSPATSTASTSLPGLPTYLPLFRLNDNTFN